MLHYTVIKNKLYPFRFHIFLNINTIDDVTKNIKLKLRKDKEQLKNELEQMREAVVEGFVYEFKGHIIVVCKTFKDTPRCWDTVTHELTHGIFKAAAFIGLKYSEESEEFFSYLMGFLVGEVKRSVKKKPSKPKEPPVLND